MEKKKDADVSFYGSREDHSEEKEQEKAHPRRVDPKKIVVSREDIVTDERNLADRIANLEITPGDAAKELLKLIYTANPFYLISACLFLYAQTILFNTNDIWIDNAIPLTLICIYSGILVATAVFIVRAGKVWEDARSLILITVILFASIPMFLDGMLIENLSKAPALLLPSLAFCIILSELLCKGLRIRLPFMFKSVYYALLGLFFVYPFLLAGIITETGSDRVTAIRGFMFFPVAVGLLLLCLIPAVRAGRKYLANNGTPWKWPWFPWILFGTLGLFACFRTYTLTIAFFPENGFGGYHKLPTGFGFYMLIPIAFAALVLLLEHGIYLRKRSVQTAALAGSAIFYLFALHGIKGHNPLFKEFLDAAEVASPMFIAIIASVAFYLYAWIRNVRFADGALLITLLISSVLSSNGKVPAIAIPGILPVLSLFGVSLILVLAAIKKKASAWALLAAASVTLTLTVAFKGTWFTSFSGVLPIHLFYFSCLVIAELFDDKFSRILRRVGVFAIPVLFSIAFFFHAKLAPGVPDGFIYAYLLVLMATAFGGYLILREKLYLYAGLLNLLLLGGYGIVCGIRFVMSFNYPGVKTGLWGGLFFAVAFLISLYKGGLIQKLSAQACSLVKNKIQWGAH